jgi:hypothetical protein
MSCCHYQLAGDVAQPRLFVADIDLDAVNNSAMQFARTSQSFIVRPG